MLPEADAWAPLGLWPDRARHKAAAAIRADVEQHALDAIGAERALIAADPRIGRVRWQILVAIFAIRPEFEHAPPLARWPHFDDVGGEDHVLLADERRVARRGKIAREQPYAVRRVGHDLGFGAVREGDARARRQRTDVDRVAHSRSHGLPPV